MKRRVPGRAALAALVAAVSVSACDCGGDGGGSCANDADCSIGTRCVGGACIADDVAHDELTIASIDGTGQARAPVSTASDGVPDDAIPAAHRIDDAIVVHGTHLDQVSQAFLEDAAGNRSVLTIVTTGSSSDGASMKLALPTTLTTGLFTLTLVSSALSQSAHAQVFLLQGEPGANGTNGTPAPASLTEARDADADECARGGTVFVFGLDRNNNGVIDVADGEVTSTHAACNVGPAFDCATGVCVTPDPLQAPSLLIGDAASGLLPVVTHIVAPTVLEVPQQFATVTAALASLALTRLDASVTIRVSGHVSEPATVFVDHQDARRISIVGADSNAVLQFPADSNGIFVDRTSLGDVRSLTLDGGGSTISGGLFGANSAIIAAHDVTVRRFGSQVEAVNNATIVGDDIIARDGVHGFVTNTSGVISVTRAQALNNSSRGYFSLQGGLIDVPACTANGNLFGLEADNFGAIVGSLCSMSSNTTAAAATDVSIILVDGATFSANTVDVGATHTSVVRIDGATGVVSRSNDATSEVVP